MTTSPPLRAIIFDFNGVLLWDNALQEQAWRLFSQRLRGEPLSELEMAEHLHGRNNRYTLQYLSAAPLSDADVVELSEQKEKIYRDLCLALGDAYRLSPGAVELLDYLADANIPRTIATASIKSNVDFYVRRLELARWFDPEAIVYDDGTLRGKPQPDFYLAAAARLGLPPRQCVVVEDSLPGMRAATAAGIGRTYALLGDGGHAHLGEMPPGVVIIRDLGEMPREIFGEGA